MVDIIASDILGIVVLVRDGDRISSYEDPSTYDASSTGITALGEQQEFQLGSLIRSTYLDNSSPSYIQGISEQFSDAQVIIRADGSDDGSVIFDSAVALTQGLWPASAGSGSVQLANGTNITSPLGGYQYVPIASIDASEDVSLEGYTDCNSLITRTNEFSNTPGFLAKANESATFLNDLEPYVNGRPVSLTNISEIYDYLNINSIYNSSFSLPPTLLAQARDLANYYEYNTNSDTDFIGIGNIAGQTLLPSILGALERIVDMSDPLRMHLTTISYEPFLSLFNMTGVVLDGSLQPAIVNYASAIIFEVHYNQGQPILRFKFKNGTDDANFETYLLDFDGYDGRIDGDLPVSTFVQAYEPIVVNTTSEWCIACQNNVDRGCANLLHPSTGGASGSLALSTKDKISPLGAGFLGAGVAIVVMSALLAALVFFGILSYDRWRSRRWSKKGLRHQGGELELASEVNSIYKEDLTK